MSRLVTPAFRFGARAARALPEPVAVGIGRALAVGAGMADRRRRAMVARNVRRVRPDLDDKAVQRAVRGTFASYARYWVESFRLPGTSEEEIDRRFAVEGLEHLERALAAGNGAILALPHLGGWEWAGFWLSRVRHVPVTVVVERLEPPELFEWFAGLRRSFGFEVVPLDAGAGQASARALRANHVLGLLSDRDLNATGVEVEFFGERTTLPAGPATLALRSGAPLLPAATYHRGEGHHGVIRPPLDLSRTRRFRADVARLTQDLAHALEDLIRVAPDQWHLMQPNWPADRDGAAGGGGHAGDGPGPIADRGGTS